MSIPLELDRDEARELAVRELANPRYDAQPPLWQQALEWLIEQVAQLLARATGALSDVVGAVVLAVIVVVLAVFLIRYGPLARRAASATDPVFGTARRSARDHRAAADAAAAAGDWATAVVERYRAVVVTLADRSLIDLRPGRTAAEAARDGGSALPDLAERLTAGATAFDRVQYGGEAATAEDDERLRELDQAVRTARPRRPDLDLAVPS